MSDGAAQKVQTFFNGQLAATDKLLQVHVFERFPQLDGVKANLPPNVKPSHVAWGLTAFLGLVTLAIFGSDALCTLVGFAYPAYMSIQILKNPTAESHKQWTTYWLILSLFALIESFTDLLLNWIPLYFLVKAIFLVWCQALDGSTIIYDAFLSKLLKGGKGAVVEEVKDDEPGQESNADKLD